MIVGPAGANQIHPMWYSAALYIFGGVTTDMVKLVVHIESFGKSSDEIDKETVSFNELQLKQANLSCVHALNELHLHEIRVVPSKHEANQC
ncbi:hypothetical protein Tco_0911457 [Tanacetum coccineum]|uniref:Uncharacterized protein n=1 Tax=Tanacetum coccineum TaxID=301880 RepID=A0ABQ5CXA7_9ASTR